MEQQALFSALLNTYQDGPKSNQVMYDEMSRTLGHDDTKSIFPVGEAKAPRNTAHRR